MSLPPPSPEIRFVIPVIPATPGGATWRPNYGIAYDIDNPNAVLPTQTSAHRRCNIWLEPPTPIFQNFISLVSGALAAEASSLTQPVECFLQREGNVQRRTPERFQGRVSDVTARHPHYYKQCPASPPAPVSRDKQWPVSSPALVKQTSIGT